MPSETELDWIQMRKKYEVGQMPETTKEKMARKIQENPLVPIGVFRSLKLYNLLWSLEIEITTFPFQGVLLPWAR